MFASPLSPQFGFLKRLSRQKEAFRCHEFTLNPLGKRWKTRFAYPAGMVAYEDDYTKTADYPSINPELRALSPRRREILEERLDWCETIKNQPTVEEKTLKMNMIRRYGWICQVLDELNFDYGSLPFYKHITRTHVASRDSLPPQYSSPDVMEKIHYFKEKIRGPLTDALKFEMDMMRNSVRNENEKSDVTRSTSISIVSQINRTLLTLLGKEIDHLNSCSVDVNPNVNAFWMVGGMEPSLKDRSRRKSCNKYYKEQLDVDAPVERNFQYMGSPLLQVRCDKPLKNFVESDSKLSAKGEDVENVYKYESRMFGHRGQFKYASIIPGYWSGDAHRCSHIGFHANNYLTNPNRRNEFWDAESENSILSQAMLGSYTRLLSQAFFFGFDQYSDVKYPFSTQTVITDGFRWSFFAYQMNTMQFDKLNIEKNQKQNICWGTKSVNLFDKENLDKLNDEVIENLLKFYLNPTYTISESHADATPFLPAKLTDYQDEKVRAVFFFNYRDMLIQKQDRNGSYRHRQFPEIYDWERIFKIRFKMRLLDARRKYYELPRGFPGSDPYHEPYVLRDPMFAGKRLRALRAENEARKEEARIEEAKLVEKSKYAQVEK